MNLERVIDDLRKTQSSARQRARAILGFMRIPSDTPSHKGNQ